jgi:hypothetical protein
VKQITTSGLGVLMSLRRQLLECGLSLQLAGLNLRQRFLLHAWCAQPLFDDWYPVSAQGRSLALETEAAASIGMTAEQDAASTQTRSRG